MQGISYPVEEAPTSSMKETSTLNVNDVTALLKAIPENTTSS